MKLLVYMDPPENLRPKDTTIHMLYTAYSRGYSVDITHYTDSDSITLLSERHPLNMIDSYDVVFLRKNPPVERFKGFLKSLSDKEHTPLLINDPQVILRDDKRFVMRKPYDIFTPETIATRDPLDIKHMAYKFGKIVLKPVDGFGGEGIIIVSKEDFSLERTIDYIQQQGIKDKKGEVIAQRYIPESVEGDRRILLWRGHIIRHILRVPKDEHSLCNNHQGGISIDADMTRREEEIVEALGLELLEEGAWMAGIDIIGGYLTEVNVTSPGGCYKNHDRIFDDLERIVNEANS